MRISMPAEPDTPTLDLGYEIFIALISILSIFNMFLVYLPPVNPAAVHVVYTVNAFLTMIFLFDFGFRLYRAKSRSFYFLHDYGWADLLACVPVLRFLRVFRIFKAYRLVHKYGAKSLFDYLSSHRADAAIFILMFTVVIIIETGSFLVLLAEGNAPDANIRSSSDAMWWVYVTITTVGYGDRYPVTDMGRLIGMLVMTTGVGVFATFAGYIGNKLLTPKEVKEEDAAHLARVPETPAASCLAELKGYLVEREKIDAEITTRLTRLERLIQEETTPPDSTPAT
jgi:voltage-gated potassium channel